MPQSRNRTMYHRRCAFVQMLIPDLAGFSTPFASAVRGSAMENVNSRRTVIRNFVFIEPTSFLITEQNSELSFGQISPDGPFDVAPCLLCQFAYVGFSVTEVRDQSYILYKTDH